MQARKAVSFITACVLTLILSACSESPPIVIGFSGQLTGKISDLGVHGRNGATLAVEMINDSGGINGRLLKLIAADDGNNPQKALEANKKLIGQGAVAIIGHMTSSQTMSVMPFISQNNVVLMSPTTSTPELTGKVDSFFRVVLENGVSGHELADYGRSSMDIETVVTISESDNRSYTFTMSSIFAKRFIQRGGEVLEMIEYSSSKLNGWDHIIDKLIQLKPQAIMLACPAQDAVSLIQRIHSASLYPKLLSGAWAFTDNILIWGGNNVEGMVFAIDYTADNPNPKFIKFRELYKNRFGSMPNFASAFAYEAVLALAEGLKKTNGSTNGLTDALAPSETIEGVIGPFRLNEFGDAERNVFIVTIQNGQFRTIEMR